MLQLTVLAAFVSAQQAASPVADPCRVDNRAMMSLGIDAFDQAMDGGWRELAQRPGCEERAADLIRTYRNFAQRRMGLLFWHEGQLRAGLGQAEAAIRLFEQSRDPADAVGWNHYVDATIAFLRADRAALVRARDALAALPPPPDLATWRGANGERPRWPMNLDVVEALVRCFGRPYEEAYGSRECRAGGGG